jgi:glycosyltransferase involved in cell wall biosynthesis
MKVLVFTTTLPSFTPGDATPPFVYELSRRIRKKGCDVSILTPRIPWSKKFETYDGIKIYRYPYFFKDTWEQLNDGAILPNLKSKPQLYLQVPFLLFFWLAKMIMLDRTEKFDLIHAHWIIPGGLLSVIAKKWFGMEGKILCTSHGADIFWLKGTLGTFLKQYVFRSIDHLTVVSSSIQKEVREVYGGSLPMTIIPMGVDENVFSPEKRDPSIRERYWILGKFILFVGRLAEKKGINYLIRAMSEVSKKYPDSKCLIVWNGPMEKELKELTDNLNLSEKVIFAGPIENAKLPAYFASADIFVWPSIIAKNGDTEWFGLVFVESLLSGCCTIGTKLPGISEIINNGVNWYQCTHWDSIDLSKTIIRAIEDPALGDKKFLRKSVEKFHWDFIAERYFSLFLKILHPSRNETLNLLP